MSRVEKLVMTIGLALLATIVLLLVVWVKLSNLEAQSCSVQARALPAQPYLTASLDDIHSLLLLPPSRQRQAQSHEIPTAELHREEALIRDLNRELGAYVKVERAVPHSRTCP